MPYFVEHIERCVNDCLTENKLIKFDMKKNQLNKGSTRQIMYVENKNGRIDGYDACIGWVTFSKTGLTVYYREKVLKRARGGGISGNHYDENTGEEYWISGIKKRGSNVHWASRSLNVHIDADALEEYTKIKNQT